MLGASVKDACSSHVRGFLVCKNRWMGFLSRIYISIILQVFPLCMNKALGNNWPQCIPWYDCIAFDLSATNLQTSVLTWYTKHYNIDVVISCIWVSNRIRLIRWQWNFTGGVFRGGNYCCPNKKFGLMLIITFTIRFV